MVYKYVGVNDKGARVGETHHRAKLTDHDIDLIRQLHEEGLSYTVIAEKFEIGKTTVADIVRCRRRWQIPSIWRKVVDPTSTPAKREVALPRHTGSLHGGVERVEDGIGDEIEVPKRRSGGRVSRETVASVLRVLADARGELTAAYVRGRMSNAKSYDSVCIALRVAHAEGLVDVVALTNPGGRYAASRPTRQWLITEKGRDFLLTPS